MRSVLLMSAAALLTSCGYVGDPLPPALNIPVAVTDLKAFQRGDKLIVEFTAPALTTDEIALTVLSAAEVRVGEEAIPAIAPKPGTAAHIEIPVIDSWVGREAALRVVLTGPKGQRSSESNSVALRMEKPLPPPSNVKAEPHAEGVRVSWTVQDTRATSYRIHREPPADVAVTAGEFIDRSVELGKEYKYTVVAATASMESLPSSQAVVLARDLFPPAAPANVTAVAGVNTIELTWSRNTEPDLKSYRVYRNDVAVARDLETPSFSDKQATAGQQYRYSVSAVDGTGNESGKSDAVTVSVP